MLCKKCNEEGKGRNIQGANNKNKNSSVQKGLDGTRKAILVKKTPIVRRGVAKSYCSSKKNVDKGSSVNLQSVERTGISLKRLSKKRKPTGELKIFKEIWEEREHVCQVTKQPIYEFDIRLFSHILSKGAYPSYRLDKRNIWIVLPSIHERWEFKDRYHPIFDEKRKVMEKLKQEYYGQGKTKG